MKIVFVLNNFSKLTNDVISNANNFKKELIKRGHEVRVISADYNKNGMLDAEIFKATFSGADVVHFFLPWKFEKIGLKIAKEMRIPVCATFYVTPENIIFNSVLKKSLILSWLMYVKFRKFYKNFNNIHCPTEFIANRIKKFRYYSKMHIIQSEVCDDLKKNENKEIRTNDTFSSFSAGQITAALKIEEMYKQVILDHKTEDIYAKTKQGRWMRKHIKRKGLLLRFVSGIIYYGFVTPILYIFNKIAYGLKIKGKINLFKVSGGAVTVCNHVHTMDSSMSALATFPKKLNFTGIRQNFNIPVAGAFVKAFNTIPVPITLSEQNVFFFELVKKLQRGEFVHFYPEGHLINYCNELREFKRGAFHLAAIAGVPVIPLAISYRSRKRLNGKEKKPFITIKIGKPIYPDKLLLKKEAQEKLRFETENAMKKLIS